MSFMAIATSGNEVVVWVRGVVMGSNVTAPLRKQTQTKEEKTQKEREKRKEAIQHCRLPVQTSKRASSCATSTTNGLSVDAFW